MLRRTRVVGIAAMLLGIAALEAQAQDWPRQFPRVTAVTRSGERVTGGLQDLAQDRFYIRTSMHDDRRLPRNEVVLLDFVGGGDQLPQNELNRARGGSHLLVTRDGNAVQGQFLGIEGGGKENFDLRVAFRSQSGEERRVRVGEVARVYMGEVQQSPAATSGAGSTAGATTVRVPANSRWVDTQLTVQQGQVVNLRTSGEIRVSPDTTAGPAGAGSGAKAPSRAPLPNAPMGALVGRVGNSAAFPIGDQRSFPSPGSGRLFLMVNDDVVSDNSGEFTVELSLGGPPVQRRR